MIELHATNGEAFKARLLAEAEQAACQAETRARQAEARLAATEVHLEELKRKDAATRMADADAAVQRMVTSGKLDGGDTALRMVYKAKFANDPQLIPLVAGGAR